MATGASVDSAAEHAGIAGKTLRDWLKLPEGRQMVAEYERDQMERTNRLVAAGQSLAVQTLIRAMAEAPRWNDRIRAATAMSQIGPKEVIVTGRDGGPIEVSSSTSTLVERLAQMRERHIEAIEANAVEQDDDDSSN
jgi:hypothetical protein